MVVKAEAGKAVVSMEVDSTKARQQTKQMTAGLGKEMKGLQGKIMGVVGALGVLAAAKGAVNMLTTLAKKTIEVADTFDMLEKQLTTLTKSETKAKTFFAAIKDFAKETPFQVRDLAQSFNMLYPIFKDKTIPMLKLIGDTAAGTGRSFQDTGAAMMRMATGDWGIEIMRQLFLVKSEFGDIFGPNGELVASQEEAWGKLQEILGDRFGGMMVGMMDTVQGKVSNLKDVLDSLASSVGVELTPLSKEFLDILIEIVKEIEETGELKGAVQDLAEAIGENKQEIVDIINLLPEMVSLFAAILDVVTDMVHQAGEFNRGWKDLWGPGGQTLLKDTLDVLVQIGGQIAYSLSTAHKLGQVLASAAKGDFAGAVAIATTKGAAPGAEFVAPKSGLGIHGRIAAELKAGKTPEEIEAYARRMGASEADIAAGYAEYSRLTEEPGGRAPSKGRKPKKPPTYEQRLAAARGRLGELYRGRPPEAEQEGLKPEELRKQREEEEKREMEHLQEMAEFYADFLDPTRMIIDGLKSGDMKQAMQDFAINLGTRVSEELLHALFMRGLLAILSMMTGGATQMAMGRGGVVKAARGLVGVLPPRPGGHMIPFGDKMINAAERGQPEVAAFLPPGRLGQDIILNKLMPMFNIKPQVEANFETRPQNNITVRVDHADRHGIRVHNEAQAGKVNKAVSVRK